MASPRGATAPKNGLQSQKGIVSVPHKYSKYRAVTRPTPWKITASMIIVSLWARINQK